jgi:hypothetical protein
LLVAGVVVVTGVEEELVGGIGEGEETPGEEALLCLRSALANWFSWTNGRGKMPTLPFNLPRAQFASTLLKTVMISP